VEHHRAAAAELHAEYAARSGSSGRRAHITGRSGDAKILGSYVAHARLAADEVGAYLWALRNGTERHAFVLVLVLAIFNQVGI
jgi:hypothetical protein